MGKGSRLKRERNRAPDLPARDINQNHSNVQYPRVPEIDDPRIATAYGLAELCSYHEQEPEDLQFAVSLKGRLEAISSMGRRVGDGPVLDIGCGVGGFTIQLARVFYDRQVIGIDPDQESLARAVARYEIGQSNPDFRQGNVYQLREYHGKIGIVTLMNVLHHLDNIDEAVMQIAAALRPGGVLFINDLDRSRIAESLSPATLDDLYSLRLRHTDQECLEIFEQRGYFKTPSDTHRLASKMSFMAAYTIDEAQSALKKGGLFTTANKGDKEVYNIFGVKILK